jgi:uncharacterized membrane protein
LLKRRIPEIDFFRTLALFLMILFHFVYDLFQWTSVPVNINSPFWIMIGKIAALLFIFLSGLSSGFSSHPIKNGIRVLSFGLVITAATWLALPNEYVRFGILHFLGTMMIVYPLLKNLPDVILFPLAIGIIGVGYFFSTQVVETIWLIPFGLTYPGFTTMDFYPLFPYSGVTIIGILFYRCCYQKSNFYEKKQPDTFSSTTSFFELPIFQKISRHSLGIYLIHQPILLFIIFGLKYLLQ